MASLQDLLAQRAALEKQIADTQREERADAIARVKSLMAEHGLSAADISSRSTPGPKAGNGTAGRKVAPKFRDDKTGDTWSGRGLQPKWLKSALASGKKLADFTI